MKLQEIAVEFLTQFCNGNIDALSYLLSEEFRFIGPLVECPTKDEYISSLRENPPVNCSIEIIKIFEDNESVGIFYSFANENVHTLMGQYFKFSNEKIIESTLIFDTAAF